MSLLRLLDRWKEAPRQCLAEEEVGVPWAYSQPEPQLSLSSQLFLVRVPSFPSEGEKVLEASEQQDWEVVLFEVPVVEP